MMCGGPDAVEATWKHPESVSSTFNYQNHGGGSQRAEVSSGQTERNFGTDQFANDHSHGLFTK